jgi:hypothetical protein
VVRRGPRPAHVLGEARDGPVDRAARSRPWYGVDGGRRMKRGGLQDVVGHGSAWGRRGLGRRSDLRMRGGADDKAADARAHDVAARCSCLEPVST